MDVVYQSEWYKMKMCLTILLICVVILQSGTSDSTCPRGGYRNKQPQFGPGCMYKCNCKNSSEQCDDVSGQCTSGCADRWMGPGCQYGDVAFKKPVNQSSSGNPASVVDGNYSTCSNVTTGTWLEVNLEKNYPITGLIITMGKIYENMTFQVEIKNRSSESSGRLCVRDGHLKITNCELRITCKEAIYGSIVKIVSTESPQWAMLCDVRIFGGRNLAYRRNTAQSSTRYQFGNKTDGWAELAVDGGTSTEFNDGSCTHTNASSTLAQWWKVDLSHVFFIKRIQIVNRNIHQGRLKGFTVIFMANSVNKTVYSAPSNEDPGINIEVADFSSYIGESVYIQIDPGDQKALTLCEVFAFGDCPIYRCGWECEKYCYCNSSISEYHKIEGTCPFGGCVENWTGTNGRCDCENCTTVQNNTQEEEDALKGVAIGVSIGAFFVLCLVIVVVVFLMNRKRRENHAKSKMVETSTQQSEDVRNVVYANLAGSHAEHTTVNTAYEVAHIILTSSNIDTNSVIIEDKCRDDIDDKNNDIAQSNRSENDVYYNEMGLKKTRIPLADLPHYFRRKAYDSKDLEKEFEKLPKKPQSSMTNAQMPVNAKKNRYKGIYAYDTTRVELPPIAGILGSDYINACFIRGFEKDRAYIASQGPTEAIVDDFWRMIWHCDVDKIVMLTELVEGEKMKCTQYWPVEGKCIYGSMEVEYLTEDVFADYTIRKFKIQQVRIVIQFHFTAWPDRGVPETPSSLVQFWSKVKNTEGKPDMPVVVHCSAGVGRTGTFIALDYLYDEGKQTGSVNVFACIYELRQQRVNMVQTKEQYVYLHEAVVEALMPTMTCVPSVIFHEKYQNLLKPDRETGKCLLQTEFEQMLNKEDNLSHRRENPEDQAEEPVDDFGYTTLSENRTKNRHDDIFPASSYRPIHMKYEASDTNYINAVKLPSHKSKNAFLLTQTPLSDTVVDFLRLVLDNEVHTIVMLDDEITSGEQVGMYWPLTGNHTGYGQIEVDVKSTGHTDTHKYRLLNLTHLQTGEVLTVKQFICTFWKPKDSASPNCTQFFTFMEAIENWQRKNKPSPTVVHCLNGAERSGLYCVVSTILERLKIDSEVSISSVIKQMRIRRPQIVPNYAFIVDKSNKALVFCILLQNGSTEHTAFEQFKFCHDVVAEFLSHFETYSNFKDI